MAEEEDKQEEGAEAAEGEEAKQGFFARNKLLIIVGGVLFLIVAIGAPVAFFMLGGEEEENKAAEKLAQEVAQEAEKLTIEGFNEEDEYLEDEERLGAIYPFRTFVVNLDEGGYLRAQIQVEFKGQVVPRRFLAKQVPVEDGMLELLSSRTRISLSSSTDRRTLRTDIRDRINEVLRREEVKRVYFTQFVIQ